MPTDASKTLLKLGVGILLVLAVSFFAPPRAPGARAQVSEIPYGGLNTVTIVCTCSAGFLNYVLDYRTNNLLKLVYQPGVSTIYSYYDVYGTNFLGTYRQGIGQCQIYVGESCERLEADGMQGFLPGFGTSL